MTTPQPPTPTLPTPPLPHRPGGDDAYHASSRPIRRVPIAERLGGLVWWGAFVAVTTTVALLLPIGVSA